MTQIQVTGVRTVNNATMSVPDDAVCDTHLYSRSAALCKDAVTASDVRLPHKEAARTKEAKLLLVHSYIAIKLKGVNENAETWRE